MPPIISSPTEAGGNGARTLLYEDDRRESGEVTTKSVQTEHELNFKAVNRNTVANGQKESASKDLCLSIVVLGASGDLAKRKTFPALFSLYSRGYLPQSVNIVGYARTQLTTESFRLQISQSLSGSGLEKDKFLSHCSFVSGQYSDQYGYLSLVRCISAHEADYASEDHQRLFYLALPPSVYPDVCRMIKSYCADSSGWTRIILEKPFGKDLESSDKLNASICTLFGEEELYRIDHYLGKEIIQNLMVMRFANRFLSPLWNRENIDNIQIIFKEPFGVEGRGGYFDGIGIIRDVVQNHLLQVLALIAMEKPVSLAPDDIRDEKLKALRAIKPVSTENVVLGQYTASTDGRKRGYLEDPTVQKNSNTPTFAMCVLYVRNERWDGVPFIIKAGKSLNEHKAEIRVQLRDVSGDLFEQSHAFAPAGTQYRNELVIRIQPNPAIYMKMTVKEPGLEMSISQSELELQYAQKYRSTSIPCAYERLILDCIKGDQQHFVRTDELRESWAIFTPLLHYIDAGGAQLEKYPYGSRGPKSADKLRERVGCITHLIERDITRIDEDEVEAPNFLPQTPNGTERTEC